MFGSNVKLQTGFIVNQTAHTVSQDNLADVKPTEDEFRCVNTASPASKPETADGERDVISCDDRHCTADQFDDHKHTYHTLSSKPAEHKDWRDSRSKCYLYGPRR